MEQQHHSDNPTEAVVEFIPQVWRGPTGDKRAVVADKRNRVEFTVPLEDATNENGKLLPTDSYKSDHLRAHENAPEWYSDWDNPFYITIDSTR